MLTGELVCDFMVGKGEVREEKNLEEDGLGGQAITQWEGRQVFQGFEMMHRDLC